jgi:hypothetical protein
MAFLKQAFNIKLCFCVMVMSCGMLLPVPNSLYAQSASAPEYSVKAAFLYNFAKFVDWPGGSLPENSSVLNLCVMENSPLGMAVESVQGNTVKGRKIVVNYINKPRDTSSCQIIFVGSSDKKHMRTLLNSVSGKNVLTVGELEGFAKRGGIINFIIVDNKVSFEINVDAAKRAGLTISSQLLKLAEIVREK